MEMAPVPAPWGIYRYTHTAIETEHNTMVSTVSQYYNYCILLVSRWAALSSTLGPPTRSRSRCECVVNGVFSRNIHRMDRICSVSYASRNWNEYSLPWLLKIYNSLFRQLRCLVWSFNGAEVPAATIFFVCLPCQRLLKRISIYLTLFICEKCRITNTRTPWPETTSTVTV